MFFQEFDGGARRLFSRMTVDRSLLGLLNVHALHALDQRRRFDVEQSGGTIFPVNFDEPVKSHISDGFVKSAEIKACESLRNEAYLWLLRSDEG